MKKIFVATDFSKGANNAAHYARILAQKSQSALTYVHIVTLPVVDPMVSAALLSTTIDELKADAEEELKNLVKEDKLQGLESEYIISFEDILETLKQHNEEGLVVVGKTGQRTFLDKLIGSTAQNLIHHVKQPLLVIPEDFTGDIFENLCYASKLEFDEAKEIAQALEWNKYGKKDMIIAHIIEEFPLDIQSNTQYIQEILKAFPERGFIIKQYATEVFKKGIFEFIEKEKVSMLFITSKKRNMLESIIDPSATKGILPKANIPIMIFSHQD